MAQARKDNKGRALRKGETQRKYDSMYIYTYTDPFTHKRRYLYSKDLMELREKEKELMKDQLDGLDVYAAGNSDLNFVFDRYIHIRMTIIFVKHLGKIRLGILNIQMYCIFICICSRKRVFR